MTANAPLLVAAWERYMAIDYGPHHTMTCFMRFWFEGAIDQQSFCDAVVQLAEIQPLLAVRLKANEWLPVAFDAETQIDWDESNALPELTHLDPDDFLVRFLVRVGRFSQLSGVDLGPPERVGTLLIVKFQHAISDGMGVMAMLEQVKELMDGTKLNQLRISSLDERHRFGMSLWQRLHRSRWDLQRIVAYFKRWPSTFRHSPAAWTSKPIHCVGHRLSTADTQSLRLRARQRSVRVNDVLIAALFRTIAGHINKGNIRLGIPVSLRPTSHNGFCNLVSFVFLDRSVPQSTNRDLLESVSAEMSDVKSKQTGHAMISFLKLACRFQGVPLRQMLKFPKTETTAVLTNLGRAFSAAADFRLGSAKLVAFDALAPLRPGTNLAVSVGEWGGRLNFVLRYNAIALTEIEAQQFLEEFTQHSLELVSER